MQTCQPVKDKNHTVAGNGECQRHEDMLAGSEACSSLNNFENPPCFPGIWCNFNQEMLNHN